MQADEPTDVTLAGRQEPLTDKPELKLTKFATDRPLPTLTLSFTETDRDPVMPLCTENVLPRATWPVIEEVPKMLTELKTERDPPI
jgi:hypothetical protein